MSSCVNLGREDLQKDTLQSISTDLADLARLSIGSTLDLVGTSLGECNAEHSKGVVVGGLNIDMCFDQGLPLANK